MKFSKDSWHFKLNSRVSHRPYSGISLCGYFWETVFSILKVFTAVLFLLLMSVVVITLLSYPISQYVTGPNAAIAFLSFTAWVLCLLGVLKRYREHDKPDVTLFTLPHISVPPVPKGLSLATQYIKAKKRKICPFIDFE